MGFGMTTISHRDVVSTRIHVVKLPVVEILRNSCRISNTQRGFGIADVGFENCDLGEMALGMLGRLKRRLILFSEFDKDKNIYEQ